MVSGISRCDIFLKTKVCFINRATNCSKLTVYVCCKDDVMGLYLSSLDECYHQLLATKILITMKNSLLTGTLTICKKNWTINFSNVLYASTENLSKRKIHSHWKREIMRHDMYR